MTAGATTLLIGERLGLSGWCGIVILAAGVLLLSLRGGRLAQPPDRRAVSFALFTALTICLYSIVDGIGGRTAGDPHPRKAKGVRGGLALLEPLEVVAAPVLAGVEAALEQ